MLTGEKHAVCQTMKNKRHQVLSLVSVVIRGGVNVEHAGVLFPQLNQPGLNVLILLFSVWNKKCTICNYNSKKKLASPALWTQHDLIFLSHACWVQPFLSALSWQRGQQGSWALIQANWPLTPVTGNQGPKRLRHKRTEMLGHNPAGTSTDPHTVNHTLNVSGCEWFLYM